MTIKEEVGDQEAGNAEPSDSATESSVRGLESPYSDFGDIESAFNVDERRLLELRLLHHFMTVVSHTFPESRREFRQDVWNGTAIRLSFDHPCLLSAILAVSSLHLVLDTGGNHDFYAHDENILSVARVVDALHVTLGGIDHAKSHRVYLNQAIRQQREALEILGPKNADAVFTSSVLLSFMALKLLPSSSTSTGYVPPVQWLRMAKAITTIREACLPLIRHDSLMEIFIPRDPYPNFLDHDKIFNPLHREPFQALIDWIAYPEVDLDAQTRETYEETLAYVGGVYQALKDKEPPEAMLHRIMAFGTLVPAQFGTLLEQGRPRALAILAHQFAMAKAVDDDWWFRGAADREVNGIRSVLPAEWHWAMEWPLSVLHQDFSTG